jgi:hypothetical protein
MARDPVLSGEPRKISDHESHESHESGRRGGESDGRHRTCADRPQPKQQRTRRVPRTQLRSLIRLIRVIRGPTIIASARDPVLSGEPRKISDHESHESHESGRRGGESDGRHRTCADRPQPKQQRTRRVPRTQLRTLIRSIRAIRGPTIIAWLATESSAVNHGR